MHKYDTVKGQKHKWSCIYCG